MKAAEVRAGAVLCRAKVKHLADSKDSKDSVDNQDSVDSNDSVDTFRTGRPLTQAVLTQTAP